MARKAKTPAAEAATPVETPAAPFAALVETVTAAPAADAAPAKIHAVTVNGQQVRTANHVATLKGGTACPAVFAATTYALTGTVYSPNPATLTSLQWQAYCDAIHVNGGKATGAQIWEAGQALGLTGAALASLVGFGPYRRRNLKVVA